MPSHTPDDKLLWPPEDTREVLAEAHPCLLSHNKVKLLFLALPRHYPDSLAEVHTARLQIQPVEQIRGRNILKAMLKQLKLHYGSDDAAHFVRKQTGGTE